MGYDAPRPQGGFYVFARTPIPDDISFIGRLQREGILAVPGTVFGLTGYMRLSLTIATEAIQRSLPGFARAIQAVVSSSSVPVSTSVSTSVSSDVESAR